MECEVEAATSSKGVNCLVNQLDDDEDTTSVVNKRLGGTSNSNEADKVVSLVTLDEVLEVDSVKRVTVGDMDFTNDIDVIEDNEEHFVNPSSASLTLSNWANSLDTTENDDSNYETAEFMVVLKNSDIPKNVNLSETVAAQTSKQNGNDLVEDCESDIKIIDCDSVGNDTQHDTTDCFVDAEVEFQEVKSDDDDECDGRFLKQSLVIQNQDACDSSITVVDVDDDEKENSSDSLCTDTNQRESTSKDIERVEVIAMHSSAEDLSAQKEVDKDEERPDVDVEDDSDGEVQVLRDDTIENGFLYAQSYCEGNDAHEKTLHGKSDSDNHIIDLGENSASTSGVIPPHNNSRNSSIKMQLNQSEPVVVEEVSLDSAGDADAEMHDVEVVGSWKDKSAVADADRSVERYEDDLATTVEESTEVHTDLGNDEHVSHKNDDDVCANKHLLGNTEDGIPELSDWKSLYDKVIVENRNLAAKLKEIADESKTLIHDEKEKNEKDAQEIVALKREVSELQSLLRKFEGDGEEGEDPAALLVKISKQNVVIGKLNDTIDEIEENLQKVYEEKNSCMRKAEELEQSVVELQASKDRSEAFACEQLANRDATIRNLEENLTSMATTIESLEKQLVTSRASEKRLSSELIDSKEKVAMLEIDVEFSLEKHNEDLILQAKEISESRANLQKARNDLLQEQSINKKLRLDLKQEVDLHRTMAAENSSMRRDVEAYRAADIEHLRKLDELRTKLDNLSQENRSLRADLKSVKFENGAFKAAAEQLRSRVNENTTTTTTTTTKGKFFSLDSCPSYADAVSVLDDDDTDSQEVITIDTDDHESDDERASNLSTSLNTMKRLRSPVASRVTKKTKLSSETSGPSKSMSEAVIHKQSTYDNDVDAGTSDNASVTRKNSAEVYGDVSAVDDDDDERVASEQLELLGSEEEEASENGQIQNGAQTDSECFDVEHAVELKQLRNLLLQKEEEIAALKSNLVGTDKVRGELEPAISSLTNQLEEEKAKVESLQTALCARAKLEEEQVHEQQETLQRLQRELEVAEIILAERQLVIDSQRSGPSLSTGEVSEQQPKSEASDVGLGAQTYELEVAKLNELAQRFDKIYAEMTVITDERAFLQKRIQVLETTDADVQALRKKNDKLQMELTKVSVDRDRLRRLLSELTKFDVDVDSLQHMIAELTEEADSARTERVELVNELVSQKRQLDEEQIAHENKVAQLNATIEDMVAASGRERAEFDQALALGQKTIEELRSELDRCLQSNEDVKKQREQLQIQITSVAAQLSDKEKKVEAIMAEATEFRRELDENRQKIVQAESEVLSVKEKLSKTAEELEDALSQSHSLNSKVEELSAEVKAKEDLRLRVEALEAELADALKEKTGLLKNLSEMKLQVASSGQNESRLLELKNRYRKLLPPTKEMKVKVNNLEKKIRDWESNLANADERQQRLPSVRTQLQEHVQNVLGDRNVTSEACEKLRDTATSLLAECSKVIEHVRDVELGMKSMAADVARNESSFIPSSAEDAKPEVTKQVMQETAVWLLTKLSDATCKVDKLKSEAKRLSAIESTLNRSLLDLEAELTPEESPGEDRRVENLKADFAEASSKASRLASEAEQLGTATEKIGQKSEALDHMLGLSESQHRSSKGNGDNEAASSLSAQVKKLLVSNECLHNRLKVALRNGRRMKALLERLQKSSGGGRDPSQADSQLVTIQMECNSLRKQLEESEVERKCLKVKLINLELSRKRENSQNVAKTNSTNNRDGVVTDAQVGDDIGGLSSSGDGSKCKSNSGPSGKSSTAKPSVASSSAVLSENSEVNKLKEKEVASSKRPQKTEAVSAPKKFCKYASETDNSSDKYAWTTKQQGEKLPMGTAGCQVQKKALHTITNDMSHIQELTQSKEGHKSSAVANQQDTENCQVQ